MKCNTANAYILRVYNILSFVSYPKREYLTSHITDDADLSRRMDRHHEQCPQ